MNHILSELKSVNWKAFFSFLENEINNDDALNTSTGRFKKEEMISLAIQEFSNNKLKYVNQQGYDFITSSGDKIEWKTQKFCLLTKKGKSKKTNSTNQIKLINTLAQDSSRAEMKFDYLVIMDTGNFNSYCVYVVDKKTIIDNNMLKAVSDGVVIKLPLDKLSCVIDNKTISSYDLVVEKKSDLTLCQEQVTLIKKRCELYKN